MKPAAGEATIDSREYRLDFLPKDAGSNRSDRNPPVCCEPETVVARRRRREGSTAERRGIVLKTLANIGNVAPGRGRSD